MNDGDHDTGSGELSEAERKALRSLPREMIPPAELEDRVVGALKSQGLLGARPAPRRGALRASWPAWVAAAAAAVALFTSGVVVGQWSTARGIAASVAQARPDDAAAQATRVQEAGSDYVRAVAHLADLAAAGATKDVEPGKEAATVALHAAALELARLSPDDPTLRLVLAVLEDRLKTAGGAGRGAQSTIWF